MPPSSPLIHIGKHQDRIVTVKKKSHTPQKTSLWSQLNEWVIEQSPVKAKEKVTFFRLLATMINAGLSLLKALEILSDQTKDQKMKLICSKIAHEVEIGNTLSDGLALYPKVFDSSAIGMIRSGEASGRLNQVLLSLADKVEKSGKLKGKIKSAMAYPIAIIVVLIGVFIAVTTLVIPKMRSTFDNAGAELPSSTQLLITTSDIFQGSTAGVPNSLWLVVFAIMTWAIVHLWKKTDSGKFYWDTFLLSIPIFGNLRRKLILAQYSRSLSTLIKSGISIVKALVITSDIVGNELYRRRILLTAQDVKQGITIAENIQGNKKMFPPMLVSMVTVGEQTAQLGEVTGKVADFYEEEVDNFIKGLTSIMEPFIIVVIGVVVGFMVTAIMSPIMQMSEVAVG